MKSGSISVAFDEVDPPADRAETLPQLLKREKVKEADVIHKSATAAGVAVAYRRAKVTSVVADYATIHCGMSLDASEADAAKIETAFKICASYTPTPK